MSRQKITRALVSVSNKQGLQELAVALHNAGVEIISTGSTAEEISKFKIPVTLVSNVTNFAEILDGRVKTLHPAIHAGILADLRKDNHKNSLKDLNIKPFDLVVVNLYPFNETVSSGANFEDCIEQIDIGGIGFESHDRLRGIQYTDFRSLRAGISLRVLSTYSKRRHKTLKQIAAMLRRTAHRAQPHAANYSPALNPPI